MTDETMDAPETGAEQSDDTRAAVSPSTSNGGPFGVGTGSGAETGEGSLLKTALDATDERSRSRLVNFFNIENGIESVNGELSPSGGITILEPSQFDAYRGKPLYISGTANLGSLESLIDYTNRHKDSDSVVFADDNRQSPSITAVLDYHKQGGPADGGQRFGRHQATHDLPLSDAWVAWHELNGREITMPNFARFLEDHIVDVLPLGLVELSAEQQKFVDALGGMSRIADPARLLELANGLRVYENSQASQAVNLASGEGEIVFTSNHTDGNGGKLNIPTMFVIAIPVFGHGALYQIVVRLRYRKSGGITFIYELWRDDMVFDHAFDEAASNVASSTSLPVFRGTRGDS